MAERLNNYRLTIKPGLRDVDGNEPDFSSDQVSFFKTQAVSEKFYYRIWNAALGDGKSLDTPRGTQPYNCAMLNTGNFSGQYWRFQEVQDGKYVMSNQFRGTGFLLEGAAPNDDNPAFLTGPPSGGGYFTGQVWRFEKDESAGWIYIINNGAGDAYRLDQRNVDLKNVEGSTDQRWTLVRLNEI